MSAILAYGDIDPGTQSQRVFRSLLQAMAEPGTIANLHAQIQSPDGLGRAQAAIALTLFDNETPVWLSPSLRTAAIETFLRFHTGAPLVDDPAMASFAIARSSADLPSLESFDIGSDEIPEKGATIIVETTLLATGSGRVLRGPGIPSQRSFEFWGVMEAFWTARAQVCALTPRGLDFIFTSGDSLTALPRTTIVED